MKQYNPVQPTQSQFHHKRQSNKLWAPVIYMEIDQASSKIFHVKSAYNEDYINDMKSKIPNQYRTWSPYLGVWVYRHTKYLPAIKWLLDKYYGGHVVEWPELSDLDKIVRGMVRKAKTEAKTEWSALGIRV